MTVEKKTKKDQAEKKPAEKLPEVKTDSRGILTAATLEGNYRIAQYYHRSKLLPARFDSPEKVMTAVQYARELGLQPLTALRQVAVIDGVPSIFGDLPLAMVKKHPEFKYIKEDILNSKNEFICSENNNLDSEPFAAICKVKRGEEPEVERFFTIADAKSAGLLNNSRRPVWRLYPKVMLKYRARAAALKDTFPDVLNGIAISEYDYNIMPNEAGPTTYEGETIITQSGNEAAEKLREVLKEKNYNRAKAMSLCNKFLGTDNPKLAKEHEIYDLIKKIQGGEV